MLDRSTAMPSDTQPIAVQIGAGNIGRGFMGELFAAAGYRIVFVDTDATLVEALGSRCSYQIHHITNEGRETVRIEAAGALHGRDDTAVAETIAGAALACTAVGVRSMAAAASALAAGLARRLSRGGDALNIITCENLVGAGRHLRDLVWAELERAIAAGACPAVTFGEFDARFGFVEAVVSRMVPVVPADVRRRDPLWIACEPYARLPVDATAFRGPPPEIAGLEPVENILAHQHRKLATHNMSHAVCAYLGYQAGHELLWQAMDDTAIAAEVRAAMDETGRALCSRFGFRADGQRTHENDLLHRYRNRALGDQIARIAADPLRKLGPEDRLIGSARLCLREGVEPAHVIRGIRAALRYDPPDDPSAVRLQRMLRARGREHVLREVCGLSPGGPLWRPLTAESPENVE